MANVPDAPVSGTPLVYVGAVDWTRADWRGRFYPDDLPEDWLLPFYNTQFQAVYLPAAVWRGAVAADWRQWLDDTREDFRFVLEPAPDSASVPASPRLLWADDAWQAAHLWWLDEAPDLRALAQRIAQHAARGEPLYVFSRAGDLARLEQVTALRQVMGY